MTAREFSAAFNIADSDADLSNYDLDIFYGFGEAGFEPVTVTLGHIARLIRWQAAQFGGGYDARALSEIRNVGRSKFIVADYVD